MPSTPRRGLAVLAGSVAPRTGRLRSKSYATGSTPWPNNSERPTRAARAVMKAEICCFFRRLLATTILLAIAAGPAMTQGIGTWRLVRTPDPRGGSEAVSIMQTADVSRSDIDFAGVMLR